MSESLEVFSRVEEWRLFKKNLKSSLGFVPTMGALHEGHMSLVKQSQQENDCTLVSIFINPTQFNNKKDLQNYPVTLEQDVCLLKQAKCDFLILPTFAEIYPDEYTFQINESKLSQFLCGKSRPGHFTGVLTVVMKLLQLAQAQKAYLGKKDYQQYLLVKKMAEAFFLTTKIVGSETVREKDGLAMSSRNLLLSPEQRAQAPLFYKILKESLNAEQAKAELEKNYFVVDYVEEEDGRRLGAVYLGDVRLIDNVEL